jgi:hypothetical protein
MGALAARGGTPENYVFLGNLHSRGQQVWNVFGYSMTNVTDHSYKEAMKRHKDAIKKGKTA